MLQLSPARAIRMFLRRSENERNFQHSLCLPVICQNVDLLMLVTLWLTPCKQKNYRIYKKYQRLPVCFNFRYLTIRQLIRRLQHKALLRTAPDCIHKLKLELHLATWCVPLRHNPMFIGKVHVSKHLKGRVPSSNTMWSWAGKCATIAVPSWTLNPINKLL